MDGNDFAGRTSTKRSAIAEVSSGRAKSARRSMAAATSKEKATKGFLDQVENDVERMYMRQFLEEGHGVPVMHKDLGNVQEMIAKHIYGRHLKKKWYRTNRARNNAYVKGQCYVPSQYLTDHSREAAEAVMYKGKRGCHWTDSPEELYNMLFGNGKFALFVNGEQQGGILDQETFREEDAPPGSRIVFLDYKGPPLPSSTSQSAYPRNLAQNAREYSADAGSENEIGPPSYIQHQVRSSGGETRLEQRQPFRARNVREARPRAFRILSRDGRRFRETEQTNSTSHKKQAATLAPPRASSSKKDCSARKGRHMDPGCGETSGLLLPSTTERAQAEENAQQRAGSSDSLDTQRRRAEPVSGVYHGENAGRSASVMAPAAGAAEPNQLQRVLQVFGPPGNNAAPAIDGNEPVDPYTPQEQRAIIRKFLMSLGFNLRQLPIEGYIDELVTMGFDPQCASRFEITEADLSFMGFLHRRRFFRAIQDEEGREG